MEAVGTEVIENTTLKDSIAATPEEVEGLASGKFIKVGAGSNVKSVAGKISHSARESEPPATLCIGASSINQAVKAICIARQYLKSDNLDLSFQPAFRGKERRASVALYISKSPSTRTDAPTPVEGETVELPISSHSRPAQVAGALAARIRDGANASLVAIGVDAVANAVLTIGNARLYLEQNNLDIRAAPEFITVQKEERELNAVRFSIKSETI